MIKPDEFIERAKAAFLGPYGPRTLSRALLMIAPVIRELRHDGVSWRRITTLLNAAAKELNETTKTAVRSPMTADAVRGIICRIERSASAQARTSAPSFTSADHVAPGASIPKPQKSAVPDEPARPSPRGDIALEIVEKLKKLSEID